MAGCSLRRDIIISKSLHLPPAFLRFLDSRAREDIFHRRYF